MSNNRILYACQGVALARMGTAPDAYNSGNMIHGVQSVSTNTTFNLEQAFELGQLDIYENIEGLPDIEVSMEKVLDGYPLMYLMATSGVAGTAASGLIARSKAQCDFRLFVFDEAESNISTAAGGALARNSLYCSGMYVSNISYTLPADGNSTESVTLVGNNKQWITGLSGVPTNIFVRFNGSDEPRAIAGSGGVQRREDVLMSASILPRIEGITGTSVGNNVLTSGATSGNLIAHIQNITISTDFSREDILELGRKTPYYRPASFPIEVTCEIEAVSTSGDFVSALENGNPDLFSDIKTSGNNVRDETIYIQTRGGYAWNLGSKNKLSSVSYGGGDAGGGNVSCTYSFSNFNVLGVLQTGITAGFGPSAFF